MTTYHPLKRISLLVTVAFTMVLTGCGERPQAKPTVKADIKLTPEQESAVLVKNADSGDQEAQVKLGIIYVKGEGVPKDDTKAFEYFQKAAIQGSSMGQLYLADRYKSGIGVAKDIAKAVDWYQKSAAQNNSAAQFQLALMHLSDDEAGRDVAKAEALLQQAADNGSDIAISFLGSSYQGFGPHFKKDLAKEVSLYRKHAERGNSTAQRRIGQMYARGDGVPLDDQTALAWYRKAAEQGDSTAQFNLGIRYEEGVTVPKDVSIAFGWFQKAAIQGDSEAQQNLGLMYMRGYGTLEDKVLAYAWTNIAASGVLALPNASKNRNVIESILSKDELLEAQRISSGWKVGQDLVREVRTANVGKPSVNGSMVKVSTGTLFVVGKAGHAITNQHVVNGCTELRIQGREGVAKLVTDDKVNDLALLQIQGQIAAFGSIISDPGKMRQGEDVLVFGFPLNAVLSSAGNLTPGIVSALTGHGNNTNQIQITAPIQPGSSGSPVMNRQGDVVGVVAMKLSDAKMAQATGQVGQNVNFAVSGQTLKTFLDTHKVSYKSSGLFSFDMSSADLADEARKWTMVVECWK